MTSLTPFPKRVRQAKWIDRFEPKAGDGLCPGFWKGCPAVFGCPFDCDFCFLRRYRFMPDAKLKPDEKPGCVLYPLLGEGATTLKNYHALIGALVRVCDEGDVLVNWGETADSLACEEETGFLRVLLSWYGGITGDAVPTSLLLTKSSGDGWLPWLLDQEPTDRLIFSFSVTTYWAETLYEVPGGAPSVWKRLETAGRLASAGWRVRLRIDPLTPADREDAKESRQDGELDAADLVCCLLGGDRDGTFPHFTPELITIGSIRFTSKNKHSKHLIEQFGMERDEGGRYRLPFDQRVELYKAAVEAIDGRVPVALCKSPAEDWQAVFGEVPKPDEMRCNCTP